MVRNVKKNAALAVGLAAALALAGCAVTGGGQSAALLSAVQGAAAKPTQAEISAALKEALSIGISKGVGALSAKDGFYGDVATRIGLPSEALVITKNVAKLPGGQALVSKVVKNINAAASDAAKEAIPIFTSALTGMTIADASKILTSKGQAATDYFKGKTKTRLKSLFAKHIEASVNKKLIGDVSPQGCWDTMTSQWNEVASTTVGRVAGLTTVKTDLVDYLTDKAVDGIFVKVAEQEKKIRTDANERTTALLRKVFARQ